MSTRTRRPAAFALDDPSTIVIEEEPKVKGEIAPFAVEPYSAKIPPAIAALAQPPRRFGWTKVFWSAVGGLAVLALGLAVVQLVEDLFAHNDILGWIGVSLTAIASLALLAIAAREVRSLLRLSAIEELRDRATATILNDQRAEGIAIARELLQLTRHSPPLARARNVLTSHIDDIIDGADLVRLAERNLMAPLDQEAKRLVGAAAKRVTVVTAVSPRAVLDILFVLMTAVGLMRRLAYLYGGRPGTLGLVRLMRLCIAHLTVTGGLAVSDGVVQQVLGHGVVAKLSTRLGEGILNGLLTARLGLAAIEVTRPLPFAALPQPSLSDLASDLLRLREKDE
jgi:putative membrane protein